MTMLEHLRREHQQLQHLAKQDRDNADWELAIWHEHEAAEVEARIATLEHADGQPPFSATSCRCS
ncbi:hypothetical protein ABT369_28330 [Dactylosporangium sp. NPDC000244]|uniref:hypothetical protein n=1 Tax=Dactylosporangium sp. NPDC000244 TaxID=3154365 RepID=UPI00331FC906